MLLQINDNRFQINRIHVYALTADTKYDNAVENVYESLNNIFNAKKRNSIIRDVNATIEIGRRSDLIGNWGLGWESQ